MNEKANLREKLVEAERIRKKARIKLKINLIMFFVVYGIGIPAANLLWDTNRTIFYVVVIYMMLNVFLQLFIYMRVTSKYSQFVSETLMNQLLQLKFPNLIYEIDDSKKKKIFRESGLFKFETELKKNEGFFHGSIDDFHFHTFRFYMPRRGMSGIFSKIQNSQPVKSDVILLKKIPGVLSGIGALVKELPGAKKLLPDVPELPGVIPEMDEYFHIYAETEEAIRTAIPDSRVAVLKKLALERQKLQVLSISFIEDQIFMYDDTNDTLYELPSVKYSLTDSSPDIMLKGLDEKVKVLRELGGF